jgi:carbon-monoxide dehydrogenase medium subunit
MREGVIAPDCLINLSELESLRGIGEEGGVITIGALTPIEEVVSSDLLRNQSPVLVSAAGQLGNPLTRNRATLGGNLADASPAADTAPPLLVLEAVIHTARSAGRGRQIALDQFFKGPRETLIEDDEIMTKITFSKPRQPKNGSHVKLGLRNAMAISVVSVAVMLEMDGKRCEKARVAVGAVAPKPIRAYGVEKKLEGRPIDDEVMAICSDIIKEEISPISDIRASAEYRTMVTSVLLKRTIQSALKGKDQ